MARMVVVPSRKLFDREKNPTVCLSPRRALGRCNECETFQRAWSIGRVASLRCTYSVTEEALKRLRRIKRLRERIARLKWEMERLQDESLL